MEKVQTTKYKVTYKEFAKALKIKGEIVWISNFSKTEGGFFEVEVKE
jgi:hypothetical protein